MSKHYVDLSDIKENDLDKTASFTDLMSRSEKKERERLKEEEKTRELKEILMNDDDKKELKKIKKKKKEEKRENKLDIEDEISVKKINDVELDNLSKTQRLIDFTREIQTSMLNNVDDNLEMIDNKDKKRKGIFNIVVTDLFIIASLIYYIYSILFTNIQTNQLYLLIGGLFILSMITLFCLAIISNRIFYKIFSILNYLIFIAYILFNLTMVLGIIKI